MSTETDNLNSDKSNEKNNNNQDIDSETSPSDIRNGDEEKDDDDDSITELDFFDFFETICDKIDEIDANNQQNVTEKTIHELKDDTHELWNKTKTRLKNQRRELKDEFQKRIQKWREHLKKPNIIKGRDKISFSIGVANACGTPLIAGKWPHLLPLVYTIQAIFLITMRFFIYKKKSWHYFIYDLCYFVNVLTLIYLWILPGSPVLFTAAYLLAHGPLALAIILWRNSLVFHSMDKVTSCFIHMYPPLTLYTIRWLLPYDYQLTHYPAIAKLGDRLNVFSSLFYVIVAYVIWNILYYILIVYGRREKVEKGLRTTSYTWLLADEKGFVSRIIKKFGGSVKNYKVELYMLLQFGYALISVIPACLWYYRYMMVNVLFLCSIFAVSVYNGATFYIDVFSQRYIKSLKLLDESDSDENAPVRKQSKTSSTENTNNKQE
ncbi:unnamed protein product [Didymodactylos carnosus]|uniref:Glycerophosphocholine acyltransferase 1 n=1 Tax=Didymodactylos carnosus TaxID=1234261 RepID=A0A813YXD3_9BILA|nr:unnamed protein product [Didymodactylos carnosus]CAF0890472.1 unnamed protein product [Didymodactylos carnosus]CAF3519019.1 unnamed protein product [Didymodactylos carnosus]CAF3674883.1 unnamed protein product [Didymodactylos carnosus]